MRYGFVLGNEARYGVRKLCRHLQVSPSAYYAWTTKGDSLHKVTDELLKKQIAALFMASRRLYGSPRLHKELQENGVRCGRKRVARLMKELDLSVVARRKFVKTTDSNHQFPVAANRLDRKFQVEVIPGVNQAWSGDITYIPVGNGWLYLAVVLDLKSRRVIGWSMSETMESTLVQDALTMATRQRPMTSKATLESPCMFHSDRGSQYASHGFQRLLANYGLTGSMSRKGNCWDNAPTESFFATLKKELVYREKYLTPEQARASLFEYIEVFYNRIRRHSALGYISPSEFEAKFS